MNDLDPIACRVQEAFDREVTGTLGRSALLTRALFPLQCLALCEGATGCGGGKFRISFTHELQPTQPSE